MKEAVKNAKYIHNVGLYVKTKKSQMLKEQKEQIEFLKVQK